MAGDAPGKDHATQLEEKMEIALVELLQQKKIASMTDIILEKLDRFRLFSIGEPSNPVTKPTVPFRELKRSHCYDDNKNFVLGDGHFGFPVGRGGMRR